MFAVDKAFVNRNCLQRDTKNYTRYMWWHSSIDIVCDSKCCCTLFLEKSVNLHQPWLGLLNGSTAMLPTALWHRVTDSQWQAGRRMKGERSIDTHKSRV